MASMNGAPNSSSFLVPTPLIFAKVDSVTGYSRAIKRRETSEKMM